MSTESQPLQKEEKSSQTFILANIKLIARSLGLITVAVMWIATVLIIKDHSKSYVGYYLIGASTLVTFFELTWIMDKSVCCVRQGCCCRIWSAIMWVDNWKKFVLYVLLSIPLFLEDSRLVLSIVSGLLLILLSTMYLIKTFRSHVSVKYEKTEQRIIATRTPSIRMITHEISTQTDTDYHMTSYTATSSEISEDGGAHKSN
ncbi:uncharacterized protein LOC131942714 isoform X1 [Physella acuta]|uniref:uncharacterized protein LOC131942714 isoform X1 n=1 Tax=Physella acuta TaxID=109671 RepID=UPI0027DB59FA|nr:uncharacterized protein LOC131942714 isoform X1 [Physella acuta]